MSQGKRRAYIVVADFAPGYEVQNTFKRKFTELGGSIVAEDRVPLSTVDYAPIATATTSSRQAMRYGL